MIDILQMLFLICMMIYISLELLKFQRHFDDATALIKIMIALIAAMYVMATGKVIICIVIFISIVFAAAKLSDAKYQLGREDD